MARKSLASSAKVTPNRNASGVKGDNSSPASSRSLRQRSAPKRTRYVERASSRETQSADNDDDSGDDDDASGYEEDEAASSESPAAESEEVDASDSDVPPAKRRKQNNNASGRVISAKSTKGRELWRQGVKTGLGPGTQVVIDKPRARSPGDTPYKDEQIHPNTMSFLGDLARNNDREWLKMHDPDYRTSWNDWMSFLEHLQTKIVEIDETVPELPLKDVIFRIYRDIRFSPDPTPYKAHFSAAWSRTGRKGPFAAYYMQIKPGGSFVGGGLWMPEASALAALRRDVDRKPHKIKNVLMNSDVRKHLLGGVAADGKKVVKAFTAQNQDNALKTKPKGFDADHKDLELLRLRNFTIGHKLKDSEVLGPAALDRVCDIIRALVPFVTYLNSVVMPDEATSASDSEASGSDAEEE